MVVRAEVLLGLKTVTLRRQEAEVEVAEMRDVGFLLWEEGGWIESGEQHEVHSRGKERLRCLDLSRGGTVIIIIAGWNC